MRTRLLVLMTCLLGACAGPSAPEEPPPSPASEDLRRLAAILDYVSSDYAGAVKDGRVLDAGEYQEQLSFMHDAAELAGRIDDAKKGVAAVDALVQAKADPAQVATAARALRRQLLDAHGLVLAPSAPPSRTRAASLFAQSCAPCHGASGGGDGPAGATLKPPPRSFRDPRAHGRDVAGRAFNALTDGMKGTGMASWSMLSAADRWALASYVFDLRHDAAAERVATPFAHGGRRSRDAGRARRDDRCDISTRCSAAGGGAGVAWLRGVAAFASTQNAAPWTPRAARSRPRHPYKTGDGTGARRPPGPRISTASSRTRARSAPATPARLDVRGGLPDASASHRRRRARRGVEREALQLDALFDRAEETLGGGGGAQVAFVGPRSSSSCARASRPRSCSCCSSGSRAGAAEAPTPTHARSTGAGWCARARRRHLVRLRGAGGSRAPAASSWKASSRSSPRRPSS